MAFETSSCLPFDLVFKDPSLEHLGSPTLWELLAYQGLSFRIKRMYLIE